MSRDDYLRLIGKGIDNTSNPGKINKYGVSRKEDRTWEGIFREKNCIITFDSKLEMNTFLELRLLQKAGKIKDIELQKRFSLKIVPQKYVADFVYFDIQKEKLVILDAKGRETQLFKLKWAMMKHFYPEYEFKLVTAS